MKREIMKRDIANLIDAYTEETLDRGVNLIKSRRLLVKPPSFILGFCAAKDETFRDFVRYMEKKLDTPRNTTEYIDLVPIFREGQYNIRPLFESKIEGWNRLPEETVLVAATG